MLLLESNGASLGLIPRFMPEVSAFGSSCPGSLGPLFIAPIGGKQPWAGSSWSVGIAPVPMPGLTFLAMGFSSTSWAGGALPFDLTASGLPQCTLWIDPLAVLTTMTTSSVAEWHLALPTDPALLGAVFYTQGFAVDPGVNMRSLITSRALRLTIGSR